MCYFLGKRSDDPDNIDWIPTIFNHKEGRSKSQIIKVDQRRKRYKSICERRASDTSTNSNKNEKCGGGKEEVPSSRVTSDTVGNFGRSVTAIFKML